jgi:phosphohistidine phosphatase
MKRLILMRHAKSDWSGGALTDHDRMLNKRGRVSAAALGT